MSSRIQLSHPQIQHDWETVVGKNVPIPDLNKLNYHDLLAIGQAIEFANNDAIVKIVHGSGKDNVCSIMYCQRYWKVLYRLQDDGFSLTLGQGAFKDYLYFLPDLKNY